MILSYNISDNWREFKKYLDEGKALLYSYRNYGWDTAAKDGGGYYLGNDFIHGSIFDQTIDSYGIRFILPTK